MILTEILPFYEAHNRGEVVECRLQYGQWQREWQRAKYIFRANLENIEKYEFRFPPKPKLRAWKASEVPIGAVIRFKDERGVSTYLCSSTAVILGFKYGKIYDSTINSPSNASYTPARALEEMEYSTDFGKTFKPCGILE